MRENNSIMSPTRIGIYNDKRSNKTKVKKAINITQCTKSSLNLLAIMTPCFDWEYIALIWSFSDRSAFESRDFHNGTMWCYNFTWMILLQSVISKKIRFRHISFTKKGFYLPKNQGKKITATSTFLQLTWTNKRMMWKH